MTRWVAANGRGTTVRCYDRMDKLWRITWQDPHHGDYVSQVGRSDGDGMVQEGTEPDGTLTRWAFSDVTDRSFLWRGWYAEPGGDWVLEQEMLVTR